MFIHSVVDNVTLFFFVRARVLVFCFPAPSLRFRFSFSFSFFFFFALACTAVTSYLGPQEPVKFNAIVAVLEEIVMY